MKYSYFLLILFLSNSALLSAQLQVRHIAKNRSIVKKIKESMGKVRFESTNGSVTVQYGVNQGTSDQLTSTSKLLNKAMCLTREEVRGQKSESEMLIADASRAGQILPGVVIDGSSLLLSGEFLYQKMDKRKPVVFSTATNMAKQTSVTVSPATGENCEAKLRTAVQQLTRPSNMTGMPNKASEAEISLSTLEESTGLSIGASFFYLGVSGQNNFSFSSEKYRYMYLFRFEQACLSVMANSISNATDVFTDDTKQGEDWYYIREVKYGRRLYVLLESESELEKFSNEFSAGLNWGLVAAAYQQQHTGSKLRSITNVKVLTQGGQPLAVTDPARTDAAIKKYFEAGYGEMDIVPLSFKLTSLKGEPVSMITRAFLDGENCLSTQKLRIRISAIDCLQADDGASDMSEQLYGKMAVLLYHKGKKVMVDGKTPIPDAGTAVIPSGFIGYGSVQAPFRVIQGKPRLFSATEQGKYIDVQLPDLDMLIELKPSMKEEDDLGDDDLITENKFKKSVRQMLLEGDTDMTFEFRHDKTRVLLLVEIRPLY